MSRDYYLGEGCSVTKLTIKLLSGEVCVELILSIHPTLRFVNLFDFCAVRATVSCIDCCIPRSFHLKIEKEKEGIIPSDVLQLYIV